MLVQTTLFGECRITDITCEWLVSRVNSFMQAQVEFAFAALVAK
jgi:hypothetical protein